jgi:hypothetical protein
MTMLAAAGGTATAAGWLTDTGIAGSGYESVSTRNDTLHRKTGLRIVGQRILFHALLDLESARLLAVLPGDCLVDVGCHDTNSLTWILRLGKVNPLTIQFALGKTGRQGSRLIATGRQFDVPSRIRRLSEGLHDIDDVGGKIPVGPMWAT